MTRAKPLHQNNIPTIQIGKNGLSEAFFNELKEQLKVYKRIRVKILKNAPFDNRKVALSHLEQRLPSNMHLIETRGWTAIIEKS